MKATCRLDAPVAPAAVYIAQKGGRIAGAALLLFCTSANLQAASSGATLIEGQLKIQGQFNIQGQVEGALQTASAPAGLDAGASLERSAAIVDAGRPKVVPPVSIVEANIRALGLDPTGIVGTIAAYRADHLDAGDLLAARITTPVVRTALEWVALRDVPQSVGLNRLRAFDETHPGWPATAWFRHQMEARIFRAQDPIAVELFFMKSAPETVPGKLALAKALRATGRVADATKLARAVFRESDLTSYLEGWLKTEFGTDLTKGDYKYRADRLLYQEHIAPALRYAAKAGADILALAKARAAVIKDESSDKAIGAVPEAWRNDPGLILAEARKLRHAHKLIEAARLMQTAPRTQAQLVDGDGWWTERRVLARDLLDDGKVNAAYITCAMHSPASREAEIEAEFHAGWIALRFMHDPVRATYHFWVAAKLTGTPSSIARIAYWQGRTADAASDPATKATAKAFYEKASIFGSTYYGQLARQALGLTTDIVEEPSNAAIGDERIEAIRVIELLYAAGDRDSATGLAVEAAGNLNDPMQVAALAAVIANQQDAHLSLTIGKLFGQRGIAVDPLAFPTFGIPPYKELANSAPPPVVYSVARQESAFTTNAVSKAGAKGLMQMIASTAKRTATKAGLRFDAGRLLHDAAFNAQLGAAHLGALIAEHDGSLILTFAAYNAGGGRVQEWIEAYGDPRKPGVDPVDWVERIPFAETRNYVQRVMANVTMYQAIFADRAKANLSAKEAGDIRLSVPFKMVATAP